MMKNLILVLTAVFISVPAFAARPYGVAGCGLGNVIFGSKSSQVLAATTNGSSYTQMFGISSGTSGCTEGASGKSANASKFIEANQNALASDVARGSGETVANLSQILGCSNPGHFATALQKNYKTIFPSANVDSGTVTKSIRNVVKQDDSLSCTI
jgi:hypothetical protein